MSVTVKSASLKSGIFLAYKYSVRIGNVLNTNSTSSDAVIHDDLKNAFRNMTPFFAHICEEITDEVLVQDAINNPEKHLVKLDDENEVQPFIKYRVEGFEIGGKNDGISVKLSGVKRLITGDAVPFSTPYVKFDSEYKFASSLNDAVELLKSEVFEYMQGKQAPETQQLEWLNDEEEEELDEEL